MPLVDLESERRSNMPGTKEYAQALKNLKVLDAWHSLAEDVPGEKLEDIGHGQSHRAALTAAIAQDPKSIFHPPRRRDQHTNHPIARASSGRGGGVAGTRGRSTYPYPPYVRGIHKMWLLLTSKRPSTHSQRGHSRGPGRKHGRATASPKRVHHSSSPRGFMGSHHVRSAKKRRVSGTDESSVGSPISRPEKAPVDKQELWKGISAPTDFLSQALASRPGVAEPTKRPEPAHRPEIMIPAAVSEDQGKAPAHPEISPSQIQQKADQLQGQQKPGQQKGETKTEQPKATPQKTDKQTTGQQKGEPQIEQRKTSPQKPRQQKSGPKSKRRRTSQQKSDQQIAGQQKAGGQPKADQKPAKQTVRPQSLHLQIKGPVQSHEGKMDKDVGELLDLDASSEDASVLGRAVADLMGLEFTVEAENQAWGAAGRTNDTVIDHSLALVQCALAGLDPETSTRLQKLVEDVQNARAQAGLGSPAGIVAQSPGNVQTVGQSTLPLPAYSQPSSLNLWETPPTVANTQVAVSTPKTSFTGYRSPAHSSSSTEPGNERPIIYPGDLSPTKKINTAGLSGFHLLRLSESPTPMPTGADRDSPLAKGTAANKPSKAMADLAQSIHAPPLVEKHRIGEATVIGSAPSLPQGISTHVVVEHEGPPPERKRSPRPSELLSSLFSGSRTIGPPPFQLPPRSDPRSNAPSAGLSQTTSNVVRDSGSVKGGSCKPDPAPLAPGRWGSSEENDRPLPMVIGVQPYQPKRR
ncbi:hypothetical protein N7492_002988 [Penicillium capsulatum]|uniref:Uncharacterized protein n=1 Tax=Penicillium capsulatum TaxID=69766 RepID=A0A9W9IKE1_9EURO|nr:hypothetical protein N7492_002988 [Penicillium capsulatum]